MSRNSINALVLVPALALGSAGCVSKSDHETVVAQLEECRTDKTAAQEAAASCEDPLVSLLMGRLYTDLGPIGGSFIRSSRRRADPDGRCPAKRSVAALGPRLRGGRRHPLSR